MRSTVQNPAMKKAVMKKAPQKKAPEMPSFVQYNEKVKSLDPDDPALDDWVDITSEDARQLAAKERKRVARALLAAAAALEAASEGDLEDALNGILEDVARAVQFAKRKQFAKAQSALEIAMAAAGSMVDDDAFNNADLSEKAEAEAGSGYPSWAR